MRVPIFSHPHQYLLFLSVFLLIATLVDVKWYLSVVLVYISEMADDVEPSCHCFLSLRNFILLK